MLDWMLSGTALWFSIPALLGTGIFLIRMVMMLMGHHGLDMAHDADLHPGDSGHSDTGDAFKLLSLQAAAAFAMGFGWAGLAALNSGWSFPMVVGTGVGGGAGMVWLLAVLLRWAYDLQSSGNINIGSAVGVEGTVYIGVPANKAGRGQVVVVLNNQQRTYNAVTDGEDLPTKTRVKVLAANEDNTLLVARA